MFPATKTLAACLFLALAVASLFGQGFSAGKITGVVTDNSGALVPDARIEATNRTPAKSAAL